MHNFIQNWIRRSFSFEITPTVFKIILTEKYGKNKEKTLITCLPPDMIYDRVNDTFHVNCYPMLNPYMITFFGIVEKSELFISSWIPAFTFQIQ